MKLGNFSVSLAVSDLKKSQDFYELLGFSVISGKMEHNYLIMKNEKCQIGLFQGMFEGNLLTFNPGWDEKCDSLENYDDIRVIAGQIKGSGIDIQKEEINTASGPGHISLKDPDGNMILIDQHI